ncbi:MAG: HAMP domain-containing histidine kinase [Ruminococcaceae bacterium]|nr:HAMP domain-containing histidine kinase [Oscillospiraceae bacterium]
MAVVWHFAYFHGFYFGSYLDIPGCLAEHFYEQTKMEEFSATAELLSSHLDDEKKLNAEAIKLSSRYDECIRILTVKDGEGRELVHNICTTQSCILHNLDSRAKLLEYCNKALASEDGVYIDKITDNDNSSRRRGTVYVSAQERDGELYFIMLNSEHIPHNATVDTLELQFGWISFVLFISAFVLALIISRSVCRPLKEMGESAERLAKGDYKAHFKGGNYREAQELADALNYAAEELSRVDRLQKELVSNISHDLRTPLTMIKGYGEVMRDIPEENTPENIQVIIDETERLNELVNDMLDISRIQSGVRRPDREIFNLTQTVKEVMSRYVKLTEHDGYNIIFDFDREIYVNADRTMILQAIYNLVNNAINYTGDDKYVKISQIHLDGRVRISVTDTGEGIAKEDMPLVWDRYYKVDKVHKRARVGTGLGLSIVKGVLEAHNAAYGLNSKLGEGSTFWFELDVEKCEFVALE